MERYEVIVGAVGRDIFLDEHLTHHDYTGYIAEKWTLNNVLSRSNGPALTVFATSDSNNLCPAEKLAEFWYLDGKLHNNYSAASPAYLTRDPAYLYEETRDYEHGLLHNASGAAVRNQFERQYYLRGQEFTEEQFKKLRSDLSSLRPPDGPL